MLRRADGVAGRQLQVFNLASKSKVGAHLMNDDVTFWTWVSDTTIGLVTEREVYHWKVTEGQAAPSKVRPSCLQIVAFQLMRRCSTDMLRSRETRSSITVSRRTTSGSYWLGSRQIPLRVSLGRLLSRSRGRCSFIR